VRGALARALVASVCLVSEARELRGQSAATAYSGSTEHPNGPAASSSAGDWKAWISLGSIEGSAGAPELTPGRRASGGNLAIWGTYKLAALCVRRTSIPFRVDETLGISDDAALIGVHVPLRAHEDFVVALGGGQSYGIGSFLPLHREGMFEGAAQFNLNYRFIGLGVDAVFGAGKTRHYAAGGVSVSLGRFR
jgi:hypothetical protein